jgi:hypothetical protein
MIQLSMVWKDPPFTFLHIHLTNSIINLFININSLTNLSKLIVLIQFVSNNSLANLLIEPTNN